MLRFKQIFSIILLATPLFLFSQEDTRNLSLDVAGGGSLIHADIESDIGYYGNFGLKYNLSTQFGVKGAFSYGLLQGEASDPKQSFENQFFQYSLKGVFNVSQMANIHKTFPNINLHSYAGIGMMDNEVTDTREASEISEGEELRDDYTGNNIVIPLGINLEFKLSDRLDLFADINYNYTNNDKLDGYNPAVAANQFTDHYSTYTLGLSFKFGDVSKKHADWATTSLEEEIERLKSQQKKRIDTIVNKVDNVESRIVELRENSADQETIKELETTINKKIQKVEEKEDERKEGEGKGDGEKAARSDGSDGEGDGAEMSEMAGTSNNVSISNKRFINVVGSFKNEEDAKSFVKKVEKQGYNPGMLYNYDNGGWYYIHINKHEKFNESKKTLKKVREELDVSDAWIYYRSADDIEKYQGQ